MGFGAVSGRAQREIISAKKISRRHETIIVTSVRGEKVPPRGLGGGLRLSDYGRMTINIEFLLAWHPCLFLWGESRIKYLR